MGWKVERISMDTELDDLQVMKVYKVSFVFDYATIVVDHNLAEDDEHAIEEAAYWMDLSGIAVANPAIETKVEVDITYLDENGVEL